MKSNEILASEDRRAEYSCAQRLVTCSSEVTLGTEATSDALRADCAAVSLLKDTGSTDPRTTALETTAAAVGATVGEPVGPGEGTKVGVLLGVLLGVLDGAIEGPEVGSLVGATLGFPVGGSWVGATLGSTVDEGAAVAKTEVLVSGAVTVTSDTSGSLTLMPPV